MLRLDQHRQPHDLHVELLHLAAHLPLLFKQRRVHFLQHLQDLCLRVASTVAAPLPPVRTTCWGPMKPILSFPEPRVALTTFPLDSTKLSPFSANVPVRERVFVSVPTVVTSNMLDAAGVH